MTASLLAVWFGGRSDDTAGRSHPRLGVASAEKDFPRANYGDAHAREFVDALRVGDEHAFGLVFRTYAPELIRYATALVRRNAWAEEAVQDAFISVWERRDTLEIHGSLRGYLFGIVRHRCVDVIRRDRIQARVESEMQFDVAAAPDVAMQAEYAELDRRVRAVLETLSPRVREVLTLRLRDELTYADIAVALGVAVKTVEAQMALGLRRLRSALGDLRV